MVPSNVGRATLWRSVVVLGAGALRSCAFVAETKLRYVRLDGDGFRKLQQKIDQQTAVESAESEPAPTNHKRNEWRRRENTIG